MARFLLRWWRRFWKAVALFAYRRWATPDTQKPTGIPGQRDPEHPCHAYAPRRRGPTEWGDCSSDGHYLCAGCCHLNPESDFAIALRLNPVD